MSEIVYPVRCMIVDPNGHKVGPYDAVNPDEAVPHVGKKGTAYEEAEWIVRIELDDGNTIYGYECWWIPLIEADRVC